MPLHLIKYFRFLLLISLLMITPSCIIVKEKDEIIKKETETPYILSPKSKIKMAEQPIRTELGDMVVSTPEGWFFIEPDARVSSDIFAIVVSPDYTLSAVFSHLKKSNDLKNVVSNEGVIGLARMCFSKRNIKSSNTILLVDNYSHYEINRQHFGIYAFTKINDNSFGKSAVFVSALNEYYEFSLVQMNFTPNLTPDRTELEEIFYSILTTLKY